MLETRKLRASSLESSRSSFEPSRSSFESSSWSFESRRQRIYRSINFSSYMYMSILPVYFWRQRNFRVARSDSTYMYVNRLAHLNRLLSLD